MARTLHRAPIVLMLQEGAGVAPAGPANALSQVPRPYWQALERIYPKVELAVPAAFGHEVGMEAGLQALNAGSFEVFERPGSLPRKGAGAAGAPASLIGALAEAGIPTIVLYSQEAPRKGSAVSGVQKRAALERALGTDATLVTFDEVPLSVTTPPAIALTDRAVTLLRQGYSGFLLVLYMDIEDALLTHMAGLSEAIEVVDDAISRLVPEVLARGGLVLISATHGNAEDAFRFYGFGGRDLDATPTTNPVPFMICDADLECVEAEDATLAALAPSLLSVMGYDVPLSMDGAPAFVRHV